MKAAHLVGIMLLAETACAEIPAARLVPAFPSLTFDRPLCVACPDDLSARVFVVEQSGRIHAIHEGASPPTASVFLDLSAKVRTDHNEEGMLALAFHPRFRSNGLFYVYYTASNPARNILSQFRVSAENPEKGDAATEVVLLTIEKRYGNHNGATVLFGPDGYLYLSLGDGGSAGDPHGNGQNLATLLGKILRLDVDHRDSGRAYGVPADNPFVGRKGVRPEIWAYGLRNVWRMSFDRLTGDLWAADVGQNKWEEIDLIVRGGNYGWNLREGKHPYEDAAASSRLIDPVIEYGRDVGFSVTGGYVYRGTRFPSLRGIYIYADYVTGTIWGMRYANGRVTEQATILKQPNNISSFGELPDGEILVTCFDGELYRVEAAD